MAGWIEVHPERIACRLARLHCVLCCSERQHLGFDGVDIVDSHVEVELLRPFTGRPRRRGELVSQPERQPQPVDGEDNPVLFGDVNIPAENTSVELRERPRVRAIQDHGSHAGNCHGQTVFHGRLHSEGVLRTVINRATQPTTNTPICVCR